MQAADSRAGPRRAGRPAGGAARDRRRTSAGAAPQATAPMPVADLRARLAALQPEPWPPDRAAAGAALQAWTQPGAAVVYLGDGLTHGGDFAALRRRAERGRLGHRTVLRRAAGARAAAAALRGRPAGRAARADAAAAAEPRPRCWRRAATAAPWRARRSTCPPAPATGEAADRAAARIAQPAGPAGAGRSAVGRRRSCCSTSVGGGGRSGSLAGDLAAAEAPLTGPLYYLRRALAPFTEVREGDLATLLQRELSVLVLADRPLPAGAERDALAAGSRKAGCWSASPGRARPSSRSAQTDPLMPVSCSAATASSAARCPGASRPGWRRSPPRSPFAGLAVPEEVKVNRQVLAEPSADLARPHLGGARRRHAAGDAEPRAGAGRIVLFHVTANADWSNLPLSGLFVDMLRRLVALSAGVAPSADSTRACARRDAGRVRPARRRRRRRRPGCRATRFARTAGLAAAPARPVRAGKRPPGAQSRRHAAAAASRRRRCRARGSSRSAPRRRNARSAPAAGRGAWCCSRSTC